MTRGEKKPTVNLDGKQRCREEFSSLNFLNQHIPDMWAFSFLKHVEEHDEVSKLL